MDVDFSKRILNENRVYLLDLDRHVGDTVLTSAVGFQFEDTGSFVVECCDLGSVNFHEVLAGGDDVDGVG